MSILLFCLPPIIGFAWIITEITNRSKLMEERGVQESDPPAFLFLLTMLCVMAVALRYALTGSF